MRQEREQNSSGYYNQVSPESNTGTAKAALAANEVNNC
jgi:hypothetical protein